ncbi:MAG: hypothetical protein B7Z78_02650 [Rhodospirillales bacterium 20-60-12]|nr:MAG: hypothetical protein B7Z78_02650 [Rhodospirillales bacterium 20-60-12]HQT66607.1 L,D-transpeptidase family protein [Acetobacteraceae bacterium]HQU01098.1 L,D-transpeptidase family protein [Acetobacteraceae bacterium]
MIFQLQGGFLRADGFQARAAWGKGGIRADKSEGDGATPHAILPLRKILYRADRIAPPRSKTPIEPIARNDGWCDDVADKNYNRRVTLPYQARHEMFWRDDHVYDLIGILGWNDDPVVKHRGSAIFLHVARPDFTPTEGCIALALSDLRAALAQSLSGIEVIG